MPSLRRLMPVIARRLKLLASEDTVLALASFRTGQRVRINHSAKPYYLHGATGTVAGGLGQMIAVQLDHPIGRFLTGDLRCPPQALDQLT